MKTTPTKKRTMFGMAGCYAMGNFTDNFFKQAAVLLAVGFGSLQSLLTVLFALPFVLFSAWAGWLSDRLPKRTIVIGSKCVELLAITFGVFSLWQLWWPGILCVIFLMATQSTIFTPAINGAIPENFARGDVPRVNSIIRSISTAAVLAGIALAGPLLDMRPENSFTIWINSPGLMDGLEFGRLSTGTFALCISFIGLLLAFSIQRTSRQSGNFAPETFQAKHTRPFPWAGPIDSCRHILEYRKDKQLFTVMSGDAFFYGLAPIVVISIANLAKSLGYSDSLSSLLSAAIMVGIAIGALIGGRYSPDSWKRLMVPSLSGMAFCLFLAGLTPFFADPFQLPWFALSLFCAGIWGGIYIIPIASFLQVHPAPHEKGKVLAASNFYSFLSMTVFGGLFWLISQLPAQITFLFYSLLAFGFSWYVIRPRLRRAACRELSLAFIALLALIIWLASLLPSQLVFFAYAAIIVIFAWFWVRPNLHRLRATTLKDAGRSPLGACMAAILSLRYKVTTKGFADISARGRNNSQTDGDDNRPILFLPNHPALVDPLIVYSRIAGLRPSILSDEKRMSGFIEKILVKKLGIITIPNPAKEGRRSFEAVQQGLDAITRALQEGNNLLLYPSGAIYRSRFERLGANSAVAHILAAVPNVRVVLVRTSGLWGSSFSRAGGRSPSVSKTLFSHLPALVMNALFFMPKRRVTVEFKEIRHWPSDKMALNKKLEDFYNENAAPATQIPYYFWQGSKPAVLADSTSAGSNAEHRQPIAEDIQAKVYALLRSKDSKGQDGVQENGKTDITPAMTLAGDLGLDSLDLMVLVAALENEFGHPVPELDKLVTVQDCLLAASGQLFEHADIRREGPAGEWFALDNSPEAKAPLYLPPTRDNLVKGFLAHVRRAPNTPLLADRSGIKTRKEVLTAALALSRQFKRYPGKRLGIMLPATPVTTIVWLALQLAGKEPVMLNWTVGTRNFAHCLTLAGVQHIVTARAMEGQLAQQGIFLSRSPVETLAPSLTHNQTPAHSPAYNPAYNPAHNPAQNPARNSCHSPNHHTGPNADDHPEHTLKHCQPRSFPPGVTDNHPHSPLHGPDSNPDFIFVEDMGKSLGLRDKLTAFVQSAVHCLTGLGIRTGKVPETAVILFTSGSESFPKGVPLTHNNILSNAADIVQTLGLTRDVRVLAMLPPFHSFGFLVGVTLPLFAGIQAAFHPNPTESVALVNMVQDFKLSLLGATPTFLEGMLSRAESPNALASLRYAFVGAEKCQDSLHALFAKHCPHGSICEGYGITECSPVIAVNRPGQAVQGSIGAPLPSVECAVVAEENGEYTPLPTGSTGMLLVRGPNIFAGYLDGVKPFVRYAGKSWYRTGDLVQMDKDGLLYFKGRLSRFVKIAGEMISLPQIESVLQTALLDTTLGNGPLRLDGDSPDIASDTPLVENGVSLAENGEPLIAVDALEEDGFRPVLTLFTPLPLTLEIVNDTLRKAGLSPLYAIKNIMHLEAIPLLGSGKVDYRQLKALLGASASSPANPGNSDNPVKNDNVSSGAQNRHVA